MKILSMYLNIMKEEAGVGGSNKKKGIALYNESRRNH